MAGVLPLQRDAKSIGGRNIDCQPRVVWTGNQMRRRNHLRESVQCNELCNFLDHLPLLKGCRQIFQSVMTFLRPRKSIHALCIAADRRHSLCLRVKYRIKTALKYERKQLFLLMHAFGLENDACECRRARRNEGLQVFLIKTPSADVKTQRVRS